MNPTRPALRYHGGKWRLAEWLLEFFPPHRIYVEPFAGGASVLLRKKPSALEIYNDIDERVVNYFRVLRDPALAAELRRALELTPNARAEHARCQWSAPNDPVEDARRLVVRSFQSVGNKRPEEVTSWRTRFFVRTNYTESWMKWSANIELFTERLREVTIECLPWQEVLRMYDSPGTLFYVDPPYVRSTRSSGYRTTYKHEFSDADHQDLLSKLKDVKGLVLLSGYSHPLYSEALEGWELHKVNARAQTNAPRVECLWLNPAASSARAQQSLLEVKVG